MIIQFYKNSNYIKMNYFNLSSSTAFLYSLYKYLCCRKKVEDAFEGDLYEGDYKDDYKDDCKDDPFVDKESKQIYPNLITPTNTPRDTNLHSRYQSKKFTFNL
jgi:hypothetical protein